MKRWSPSYEHSTLSWIEIEERTAVSQSLSLCMIPWLFKGMRLGCRFAVDVAGLLALWEEDPAASVLCCGPGTAANPACGSGVCSP